MRKRRPRSVQEFGPAARAAAEMHEIAPGLNAYEIVVGARLGRRWAGLYEGFMLLDGGDGTTVCRAEACDQAALFGILGRIRDIGAPLLAVRRVAAAPTPPARPPVRTVGDE